VSRDDDEEHRDPPPAGPCTEMKHCDPHWL
jgi:hypothetical protein